MRIDDDEALALATGGGGLLPDERELG